MDSFLNFYLLIHVKIHENCGNFYVSPMVEIFTSLLCFELAFQVFLHVAIMYSRVSMESLYEVTVVSLQ